jgi:hypothetical protein
MKPPLLFCLFRFAKLTVAVLLFVFISESINAQKVDTLFKSDEVVNIELRSDFSAIQKDRIENPLYHDGELIYKDSKGKVVRLTVKVMARGDFRRSPENCSFPPLALNFKKNEVKNTLFDNQDKLKLVTPCQFDRDVIEEYLIYKMYNKVTELSFNVRLVKILYFDTGIGKKLFEKYSFFIEHDEQVAERNNAVQIDKFITPFDVDKESFKRLALFQFMIGNKDWFVTSRRNVILLQPKDSLLPPYVVPYDFDFASFVNAAYTKPKRVPDEYLEDRRQYKGLCYTVAEFREAFDFYNSLRPSFESIIRKMKIVPMPDRETNISYIDVFYEIISSTNMVKEKFLDVCETRKDYNLPEK